MDAKRCVLLVLVALVAVSCSGAEGRAGSKAAAKPAAAKAKSKVLSEPVRYVSSDDPSITLTMKEAAGAITGTVSDGTTTLPLVARRVGATISGMVGTGEQEIPFTASERDGALHLELGAEGEQQLTFRRTTAAAGSTVATGKRSVVINEKRLSDEELARAEQTYRVRIPDAEYWYDRTLGAWGPKGGPTMGFIAPGLELGGPLQPNASGGGTGVFVNGRALHPADLAALQQITGPIAPGRYFITAQGLAGYEGGPPQWDLAAMAAQSRGGAGGGSNTWQSGITGASGFSDGTTGAVFLPNGGIVSTGN